MLGAIEAGGTKFVCAVSDNDLNIIELVTIPTSDPIETFNKVFEFFDRFELEALGIGTFGPIDTNKESKTYGYITATPKKHWSNTSFQKIFEERYKVPVGWNTDVNAAALGEVELGAAKDKDSCVYITVGTGIGGGAYINGEPLTGLSHPEMGHFYPQRHEADKFEGVCSFHGNCLEGLASGPAIESRAGIKAEELAEDDIAWDIEAYYLAQAAIAYTTILSPSCIIFGGGVMKQRHLIEKIRDKFEELLNSYLSLPPLEEYLILPRLGDKSGITGSLLLAKRELQ